MENNNTLEDLKKTYSNYKKKKYSFGKYGTGDQIRSAFSDGKTFVLKANNRVLLSLIIVLIPIVVILSSFIGTEDFILILLSFGIVWGIFSISIILLIFLLKRYFIVIGSSGVYYRKMMGTHYFQWGEVTITEASIHKTEGGYRTPPVTTAIVIVILPNGKKVKFASIRYKSKEFIKNVKRLMFLRLFQIYFELGKKTIDN